MKSLVTLCIFSFVLRVVTLGFINFSAMVEIISFVDDALNVAIEGGHVYLIL